jgi:histidine ammonia-lyase
VELLAAVQGLQLRQPLIPSPAARAAIAAVGPIAGKPGPDHFLAPIIEQVKHLIESPALKAEIETAVGPLH